MPLKEDTMDYENVYDELMKRGYTDDVNFPDELKELLGKEKVKFYIGFDATADSLTLGHYLTIMAMKRMQNHGHIPVVLMGGGTTMIGDPSGRDDMRKLMTEEFIDHNIECFMAQMRKFIDFSEERAIMDNNKHWLLDLNFVKFMREIGVHFNVNRMLSFDIYKNRMEEGLTFFEMGYMLLQSYDFLELYRRHGVRLQMGGADQWANMLYGTELINKAEGERAYCLTFKLLTTHDGQKMGKSMKGAIFLDKEKTSPYEMFQYLRNIDDHDVKPFLNLLTMLPDSEVEKLSSLKGSEINKAKEVLAYEVVKDVHGKEEADKALEASYALFKGEGSMENIPEKEFQRAKIEEGIGLLNLLTELELTKSNGEARRLIEQGGIFIDGEKITDYKLTLTLNHFKDDQILIQKGKKTYLRVILTP